VILVISGSAINLSRLFKCTHYWKTVIFPHSICDNVTCNYPSYSLLLSLCNKDSSRSLINIAPVTMSWSYYHQIKQWYDQLATYAPSDRCTWMEENKHWFVCCDSLLEPALPVLSESGLSRIMLIHGHFALFPQLGLTRIQFSLNFRHYSCDVF
jgi:hypothetical protein